MPAHQTSQKANNNEVFGVIEDRPPELNFLFPVDGSASGLPEMDIACFLDTAYLSYIIMLFFHTSSKRTAAVVRSN